MKKLILMFFVAALFACNNESETDTTRSDTTVIEQDNTINRDTGIMNTDTTTRTDSIR